MSFYSHLCTHDEHMWILAVCAQHFFPLQGAHFILVYAVYCIGNLVHWSEILCCLPRSGTKWNYNYEIKIRESVITNSAFITFINPILKAAGGDRARWKTGRLLWLQPNPSRAHRHLQLNAIYAKKWPPFKITVKQSLKNTMNFI